MSTSHSEVARLRQQIERECQALEHLMHAPAMVASHHIITHKYQSIGQHMTELAEFVGVDQATEMVARVYTETLG